MTDPEQIQVFLVDDYYTGVFFDVPAERRGYQPTSHMKRRGFHVTVPVQQLDRWRRVYEEFAVVQEEMQLLIDAAAEAKHQPGTS